jgi:hypothetical protein
MHLSTAPQAILGTEATLLQQSSDVQAYWTSFALLAMLHDVIRHLCAYSRLQPAVQDV